MTVDNIPESLINELQDIYWDPSNDEKPSKVKLAIVKHLSADQVLVRRDDLAVWLDAIREGKQFKEDAERDIGWAAESFYRIEKMAKGNPFKLLNKVMLGSVDLKKDLGLDFERLTKIGEKYAPLAAARLKEEDATTKLKK